MEEVLADSDEEEEEEEEERGRRGPRQPRGQAWLKEGAGDEPLNFLDSNVAQRVLGEERGQGSGGQQGLGTGGRVPGWTLNPLQGGPALPRC